MMNIIGYLRFVVNLKKLKFKRQQNNVDLNKLLLDSVIKGDLAGVENALRLGANVNSVDEYGESALHYAASKSGELVMVLLDAGANLELKNSKGLTPLFIAINKRHDSEQIVKIMISYGALLENKDDIHGMTPLHWAVKECQYNIVLILLQAGSNVNAKDNEMQTPLIISAWAMDFSGYSERASTSDIAWELIQHGADINAIDVRGETALDHAKRFKKHDMLRFLIPMVERSYLDNLIDEEFDDEQSGFSF